MTGKVPKPAVPAERLERYDRLIEAAPGVVRKGASMPYTSVNGHMFSYIDDGHLVLRLPRDVRDAFLERYHVTLHAGHGTVQKEYVDVPDGLFANTAELVPFFQVSHAYVAGLKPKPTKRSS